MLMSAEFTGGERLELQPATMSDFEKVRDAYLDLASEPDAQVEFADDGSGVRIKIIRFFGLEEGQDEADHSTLLIMYANGLLQNTEDGQTLKLQWVEKVEHPDVNTGIFHRYIFGTQGGDLTEFAHGVNAHPKMPEVAHELTDIGQLWQVNEGRRFLKSDFGEDLELSRGDCSLLAGQLQTLTGMDCHSSEIPRVELPQPELLEKFSI
jgi:hypothetical protein